MFRAERAAAARTPTVRERRAVRRGRAVTGALLAAGAGFVALWPFTSVVVPGPWSLITVIMIIAVTLAGMLVRVARSGRRTDGVWPLLAQLAVAVMGLTMLLVPHGAILGAIPTGATLSTLGRLAADAVQQVQFGTAPLADTLGLRTVVGIGFAAIAILLDQLIAGRLALPSIILVGVIGAVPMIVTRGEANLPWFVLLALLALFLLRRSIRHGGHQPHASAGVSLGVGAAAIVTALVVTPLLPISTTSMGAGTSAHLDPSLRLGEDLRRPAPFTVMTLATGASSAPYLRIASLSTFDGTTWSPDQSDLQSVSDGFGEPDWTEDIATEERRTSIRINAISGSWLPVPYAATKIVGASAGWQAMPLNRTVTSQAQDAANEDYTVTSEVVQPTREQIQQTSATSGDASDVPAFIAETAREVTADETTDYDQLIALQNWFRSQFDYSLEAPVNGDFDGTGAEAVEEFLRVRSGYCIHFAGAFALMAQALDMQVRIVVGYLPGSPTDERRGDEPLYTVSSDQLHSWPEVHFEGIGWVPFEPTASLGTPTDFLPATTEDGTTTDPDAPQATVAPSAAPTSGPAREEERDDTSASGSDSLRTVDAGPVVLTGAGILLVLLVPLLVRLAVRITRSARARGGDAAAAWRELRATLLDLRLPVSDADSPRARGSRLVQRGADPDDVARLVDAVERASFSRQAPQPADLARPLARVTAELRRTVDPRDRVTAWLMPRSLLSGDAPVY